MEMRSSAPRHDASGCRKRPALPRVPPPAVPQIGAAHRLAPSLLPPRRSAVPDPGSSRRGRYLLGAAGVPLGSLPLFRRPRRLLGPVVSGGRLFPASRGGAHPLLLLLLAPRLPAGLRRLGLRVGLPGGVAVLHRGGLLEADAAQQAAHRAAPGRRRASRRPRRPRAGSGRRLPTAAAWRGGAGAAGAAPPPGPSPQTGAGRSCGSGAFAGGARAAGGRAGLGPAAGRGAVLRGWSGVGSAVGIGAVVKFSSPRRARRPPGPSREERAEPGACREDGSSFCGAARVVSGSVRTRVAQRTGCVPVRRARGAGGRAEGLRRAARAASALPEVPRALELKLIRQGGFGWVRLCTWLERAFGTEALPGEKSWWDGGLSCCSGCVQLGIKHGLFASNQNCQADHLYLLPCRLLVGIHCMEHWLALTSSACLPVTSFIYASHIDCVYIRDSRTSLCTWIQKQVKILLIFSLYGNWLHTQNFL